MTRSVSVAHRSRSSSTSAATSIGGRLRESTDASPRVGRRRGFSYFFPVSWARASAAPAASVATFWLHM